jgi:two-component system, chemotaxis family, chemotaxis protein CheY
MVMEIKALVADSSKQTRKNITRSLKEIGVRNVVEANDTKQAIELVKKGSFDVIFAEFKTTTGTGEDMLKTFRKMDAKVPIIVTAPQTQNVAELKKTCPTASSYLTTPFTTEQLRKTVSQYVPSIAG